MGDAGHTYGRVTRVTGHITYTSATHDFTCDRSKSDMMTGTSLCVKCSNDNCRTYLLHSCLLWRHDNPSYNNQN
jgi:hypothetical protein